MSNRYDIIRKRSELKRADPDFQAAQRQRAEEDKKQADYINMLRSASDPDPKAPYSLGWRVWIWDTEHGLLRSPSQGTLWHTNELRVPDWSNNKAVRNHEGIHAVRMPKHWTHANFHQNNELNVMVPDESKSTTIVIDGVVEMGPARYVLGTLGWRAEWVFIRKLRAPNNQIGLMLEAKYVDPDSDRTEVYYGYR